MCVPRYAPTPLDAIRCAQVCAHSGITQTIDRHT